MKQAKRPIISLLITIEEFAELTSSSVPHIRNLIDRIPVYKVRRWIRIPRACL